MTTNEIKKIAEGRVWTGTKAKELGLVDELGGLDKALEIAIGKARLDAYTVMSYPGKKSFFDMLTDTKPGRYIQSRILKGKVGELYNQLERNACLNFITVLKIIQPVELVVKFH